MYDTTDILETESLDTESLLSSLSLDLITDNIMCQVNNYTTSTTDFLDTVKRKFDAILADDMIDDDDKSNLKYEMVEFCSRIIADISNVYNIAVNMISDDYETAIKLLSTLYNFLVLNKFSNVEKFLINYIKSNKMHLIETLDLDDKAKDITSIANRKKNMDKYDVCILSCVTEITNFIVNGNFIEPEEFIQYIDDGEIYISYMRDYYADMTISGNFANTLLHTVVSDGYDGSEVTRIRNSIRTAFYNN